MPVVGENFGQPFQAHRLHRNTIDQTVPFVWTGTVKFEPGNKGFVTLWKNANGRIMQYRFHVAYHFPARRIARKRQRNPVECVGENRLHGFLLGNP
jgi:hypothetical protein